MAKTKQSLYETYRLFHDEMLSLDATINRDRSKKETLRISHIERIKPLCEANPSFATSLDHAILSEEMFWQRSGGVILCPDSSETISLLHRAKFDVGTPAGLRFPFSSFMLGLPKGFIIDGMDMPGCLVTWLPITEYNDTVFGPLDKALGYTYRRGLPKDLTDTSQMALSISFIDPSSATRLGPKHTGHARSRFFIESNKIPRLLNAQSNSEFLEITGKYTNGDMPWVGDVDDSDITMERHYMKIVLALSVYFTATEGECIERGSPSSKVRLSPKPSCDFRITTLRRRQGRHPSPAQVRRAEKTARRAHTRTWHFRQLQHERYYKGKYANWERGSRIIFIPEAEIGN